MISSRALWIEMTCLLQLIILDYPVHQINEEYTKYLSLCFLLSQQKFRKGGEQIYIFRPKLPNSFAYKETNWQWARIKHWSGSISGQQASELLVESITVNVITLQLKTPLRAINTPQLHMQSI